MDDDGLAVPSEKPPAPQQQQNQQQNQQQQNMAGTKRTHDQVGNPSVWQPNI